MRDFYKILLGLIGGLFLLLIALFATGAMDNFYGATLGRQAQDIRRENFTHSQSYVQGKAQDLAKYKRQYEQAKTKEEKEQIRNYILHEFAGFNKETLSDRDLVTFLYEMEGGK